MEIKKIVSIWNNYFAILPLEPYEYEKNGEIINKIKNDSINLSEIKDLNELIELVKIIQETVYNNCTDKEDEIELNYCSKILDYLSEKKADILEDLYDINVSKKMLEDYPELK
jgi:predicted choloylglycine hydrolase